MYFFIPIFYCAIEMAKDKKVREGIDGIDWVTVDGERIRRLGEETINIHLSRIDSLPKGNNRR